jgi:WD40 repeat protein
MYRPLIAALLLTPPILAADAPNFEDHVLPLLRDHCVSCHRPGKTRAGLDLTNVAAIEKGGSSGASVVPGVAENSLLYRAIAHIGKEEAMPPDKDRLSDPILKVFKAWIEGGLKPTASGLAKKASAVLDIAIDPATLGAPKEPIVYVKELPSTLSERKGRALPVSALATNPWAPVVAVGGHREAVLHDLATGKKIGSLPFAPGDVRVLRFSRNGKLVLIAGGKETASGKAALVDVATGNVIATIGDDFDVVLAADLSPDQSLLALGGPEKLVRVYRVADGSLAYTVKKHTDFITSIEFSPDGKSIASGDRASGLYIYPAVSGTSPALIEGVVDGVHQLAWRPDGKVLGVASGDGSALIVDPEKRNIASKWDAHKRGCLSLAFAKDGRILTGGHDGTTRLWKGDGTKLSESTGYAGSIFRVALNHNDSEGFASDWSGQVRVWRLDDGSEVRRLISQ